jgi:hypothetical protein
MSVASFTTAAYSRPGCNAHGRLGLSRDSLLCPSLLLSMNPGQLWPCSSPPPQHPWARHACHFTASPQPPRPCRCPCRRGACSLGGIGGFVIMLASSGWPPSLLSSACQLEAPALQSPGHAAEDKPALTAQRGQ